MARRVLQRNRDKALENFLHRVVREEKIQSKHLVKSNTYRCSIVFSLFDYHFII